MSHDNEQLCNQRRILIEALALARRDGISIMGAGLFARALGLACRELGIQVHAFVVSMRTVERVDGINVVAFDEAPDRLLRYPLWIGIFNHQADAELVELRRRGLQRGFGDVRTPQEFFPWVREGMGWRYWLAPLEGYEQQWSQVEQARSLLADEESQATYDAIIAFRRGLFQEGGIPVCTEQHYFPESLRGFMPRQCHFLDGGAYDGDTLRLAGAALGLEQGYAFEPDPDNYRRLCQSTSGQSQPVVQFPLGLSDTPAFLRFRAGQGEASVFDSEGDIQVQVAALDDLLRNVRVDFLKLDIEGSEVAALQGARRLIRNNLPFLAIAGYHRWDDLWRIPLLIRDLSPAYRILLRTHKFNSFESVFYAYEPGQATIDC